MADLLYAGIGSRETPTAVLDRMKQLARRLALRGYTLRSGGARGADSAFENGAKVEQGSMEIWVPEKGFRGSKSPYVPAEIHFQLAATVHPAWNACSPIAKALHARNTGQILGRTLDTPVSFVLCWTRDGCESFKTRTRDTGGTGTAIALASQRGIPVFNLKNEDAEARLIRHVLADCRKFHPDNTLPTQGEVWVFGSNLGGRHGKGAAKVALDQFGAIYGQGEGLQGQSYGIPTKNGLPNTVPLSDPRATLSIAAIAASVSRFIEHARKTPEVQYFITRLGCVLAAHTDADIAPLFARAPSNCSFPEQWRPWLGPRRSRMNYIDPAFAETRVVHIKHAPFDVYIGRKFGDIPESIWHNPFRIGPDGTREEVVAKFNAYLDEHPELLERVHELRGCTLGCHCKAPDALDTLCHGDVLAARADGREWSLPEPQQGSLF